jgi:NTP pyrophosphatase (non-canonical NTP hydrolase)
MEIKELQDMIVKYRDDRNWKQFHNPKDVALSLLLESTELLEHFQWKNGDEIINYVSKNKDEISKELADVFYWVLLMAKDLDIDISKSLKDKMIENENKYPIEKAFGNATKYNKL